MYPNHSLLKFVLTLIITSLLNIVHADEYSDVSKLVKNKQYPEALTKVDQFLSAKPRDPQMRFIKGVIQSEMGKVSDATNTFTRLTEDFPELPEPYNNLAVIYAGSGQLDKARAALEMAIKTNPTYATAHENLGDIYARLASQAYTKALQLDSANTAIAPKLGLIRELFPTANNVKPVNSNANQRNTTSQTDPVVASIQPKQPTAVLSPPSANTAPSIAPPVVANSIANRDISTAVDAWAKAWSERNMNAYFASYTKDFTPNAKQSHEAWQEERTSRIKSKTSINVKLTNVDIKIHPDGNKATVKFKQDYKADSLSANSKKTLEMTKINGRWLISKEIAG